MPEADVKRTIDAIWRIESARLIAGLARIVRDVGLAEDLAQEAFVAALEQWPESGVPERPGAWLMATAKHRAFDRLRRARLHERKMADLLRELERSCASNPADPAADTIDDDLLRLIFMTCHPVLSADARVALTLRLLGGLTTAEIARAYLVAESTIAQRIVRGKKTLTAAHVPFQVPNNDELPERLGSVLEAIYLIFNEGYSPTAGDSWVRTELLEEALRLGRILAGLMPQESEVHGLVALMELQASRSRARVGPRGEPVLLNDQDRSRWDYVLVTRGLAALDRATTLKAPLEPYTLQGPEAGLELVDALADESALRDYHLLPSVRGDLLAKLGRSREARREFDQAAALATNVQVRKLLRERASRAVREKTGL